MSDPITALVDHLTRTPTSVYGFGQATITPTGVRVEVTDPAAQHQLRATYSLVRHATFTGSYTGLINGVPVTVALVIPTGIIPARGAA